MFWSMLQGQPFWVEPQPDGRIMDRGYGPILGATPKAS